MLFALHFYFNLKITSLVLQIKPISDYLFQKDLLLQTFGKKIYCPNCQRRRSQNTLPNCYFVHPKERAYCQICLELSRLAINKFVS